MNRLSRPVCELGGWPGGDGALRLRMLCFAVVRMKV